MYLKVGAYLDFAYSDGKYFYRHAFNGIILSVHLGQKALIASDVFSQPAHLNVIYPSKFRTIYIYIKPKAQIRIWNRISI